METKMARSRAPWLRERHVLVFIPLADTALNQLYFSVLLSHARLKLHEKVFSGFLLPVLPKVMNVLITGVKHSLRVVAQAQGPFHRDALLLQPLLATSLTTPQRGKTFSSMHGDAGERSERKMVPRITYSSKPVPSHT